MIGITLHIRAMDSGYFYTGNRVDMRSRLLTIVKNKKLIIEIVYMVLIIGIILMIFYLF